MTARDDRGPIGSNMLNSHFPGTATTRLSRSLLVVGAPIIKLFILERGDQYHS